MEFNEQKVNVKRKGTCEILLEGHEEEDLYNLPMKLKENLEVQLGEENSAQLWHFRLGHLYDKAVVDLINSESTIMTCNKKIDLYSSFLINKAHVLPHKERKTIYIYPLELIFDDTWGPSPVISLEGY